MRFPRLPISALRPPSRAQRFGRIGLDWVVMKSTPAAIPKKWTWHQRTLLRLREELLHARQEHATAARASHERGGADVIDIAEDEVELRTLRAELALEESALNEIEAALQRLQDGTYGICTATGEPLAPERLRALPWTRFSKAAAARQELAAGQPRVRDRRGRR